MYTFRAHNEEKSKKKIRSDISRLNVYYYEISFIAL